MYGYVYETTNLVNGKKYIGQHKATKHDKYLGSGTILRKAIRKHGKGSFNNTILEWCKSLEELNMKEREYINKVDALNDTSYYNIVEGGLGGVGLTGKDHPLWGKKHSTETLNKMSASHKGVKLSQEHVEVLKIVHGGKNNGMYGKKHSEETKAKIAAKRTGCKASQSVKDKMSRDRRGSNHPMYGIKRSEETKAKISLKAKIRVKCPYCGVESNKSNMTRFHFDNCKFKDN